MERSVVDPCVIIKRNKYRIIGVTILQVDDRFSLGNQEFLQEVENSAKKFNHKPTIMLNSSPARFNGILVKYICQRMPRGTPKFGYDSTFYPKTNG